MWAWAASWNMLSSRVASWLSPPLATLPSEYDRLSPRCRPLAAWSPLTSLTSHSGSGGKAQGSRCLLGWPGLGQEIIVMASQCWYWKVRWNRDRTATLLYKHASVLGVGKVFPTNIYHIEIKFRTRTGKFTFYSSDDLKLQKENSLGIENTTTLKMKIFCHSGENQHWDVLRLTPVWQ